MFYDATNDRYFTAKESRFQLRPRSKKRKFSEIQVKINNGSFEPFRGRIEFDGEGLNIIQFRSPDPILKWSPTQSFKIFVDQTPPKSQVLFEGANIFKNGYTFIHPNTQFRIEAQDRLSGVKEIYWRFGKNKKKFPGKAQFKKPGKYRFEFASIDQVDNWENWNTVQFIVDQKSPRSKPTVIGESSIKEKFLYLSTGSLIELESKDDASGISKIEYQINKGPIGIYKQPIAINAGKTELKYRAFDQVGNIEPWKTFIVHMDNRSPELDIRRSGTNVITRGKIYAKPGFKISPIAKDTESGIDKILYKLGENEWIRYAKKPIHFNAPGNSIVLFKAIDKVGNTTEAAPIEVIIDPVKPKTQYITKNELKASGKIFQSGIPNTIRFRSEDHGVGIDRIEYSFDNKNFIKFKDPIDFAKWNHSQRTIYFRAVDRLGNKEFTQKLNIQIKRDNPQADLFVESKIYPPIPLSKILNKNYKKRSQKKSRRISSKKKKKRSKRRRR